MRTCIFLNRNGYPGEPEAAVKAGLIPGNTYGIEREDVYDWHTNTFLKDFPGKAFNSVMFVEPSAVKPEGFMSVRPAPPTITPDHIRDVCKPGQGAECCSFFLIGPEGFSCAKFSNLCYTIEQRRAEGTMNAKGDNCEGCVGGVKDRKLDAILAPTGEREEAKP